MILILAPMVVGGAAAAVGSILFSNIIGILAPDATVCCADKIDLAVQYNDFTTARQIICTVGGPNCPLSDLRGTSAMAKASATGWCIFCVICILFGAWFNAFLSWGLKHLAGRGKDAGGPPRDDAEEPLPAAFIPIACRTPPTSSDLFTPRSPVKVQIWPQE